jgi:hypothetical protein
MREAVKEWALPGSPPLVQRIGMTIQDCFDGVVTYKQAQQILAVLVKEKKIEDVKDKTVKTWIAEHKA